MRLLPLLAAVLLCAGCSSNTVQNGPLSGTWRFVGDDEIEDLLEVQDASIATSLSDLPQFQVDLVNIDDEDVVCQWRARWYDARGMEITTPARSWQVLFIPAGSHQPVRSVGPSVQAMRCEIEIRLNQAVGG